MNEFSKTVKTQIEKRGISLSELSEKVDIPEAVLNDYTREYCADVRIEYADRLAKFFEISMDELLMGPYHGNMRVTILESKLSQVRKFVDNELKSSAIRRMQSEGKSFIKPPSHSDTIRAISTQN